MPNVMRAHCAARSAALPVLEVFSSPESVASFAG
jgi:hypothetical protein